ncbi:hypothetical protein [Paenibacillus lemnae]|uniref:Uncharacterized protein n=1 Tax=Paenibacillus lemnae TaxID=1330551 RepID=A0A848M7N6_PAELE|nr:hypothetical protein [Paenibacillus lemnae]NMO96646.1 hypothetical protein [Paenibacillus lemnae]
MKFKKLLLTLLTLALLIVLALPSSLVTAQESHLYPESTLTTTEDDVSYEPIAEEEILAPEGQNAAEVSISHEQIAHSLGIKAGNYDELQSDPNAERKTYYYIEYTTVDSSDKSTNSTALSESTVTVVPPEQFSQFIENKERDYELSKNNTTVINPLSKGDSGGIAVSVTLRSNAKPTIESTAEVVAIVGDKPKMIQFFTTFYKGDTRKHSGSSVSTAFKKEYQKSNVRVGASATHFHTVSKTGFYYSTVKLKVFDGFIVVSPVGEKDFLSNIILLNKNGIPYPFYY